MEDGDYYFVERNAAVVTDHRTGRPVATTSRSPAYIPPPAGSASIISGGPGMTQPVQFARQVQFAQPVQFTQVPHTGVWGGTQPAYLPPPGWGWGQPGTLGGLFNGLNNVNIGSLIELVGQGFAAIRSLPTAPTSVGDGTTDIANLTLYQQALAEHGKSDEQIRTAVHIIGKLLGA